MASRAAKKRVRELSPAPAITQITRVTAKPTIRRLAGHTCKAQTPSESIPMGTPGKPYLFTFTHDLSHALPKHLEPETHASISGEQMEPIDLNTVDEDL